MKPTVIKVIKLKALDERVRDLATRRQPVHPTTVTSTVNDWIEQSRRNKLDDDISSRKTIAAWATGADI